MSKLDELAELVKARLCHKQIAGESSTNVICGRCGHPFTSVPLIILNDDDPMFDMFETFWEPCLVKTYERRTCRKCNGYGFVRHSLAESVMLLPEALRELGYVIGIHGDRSGWHAVLTRGKEYGTGDAATLYEALSAAELDRRSHDTAAL